MLATDYSLEVCLLSLPFLLCPYQKGSILVTITFGQNTSALAPLSQYDRGVMTLRTKIKKKGGDDALDDLVRAHHLVILVVNDVAVPHVAGVDARVKRVILAPVRWCEARLDDRHLPRIHPNGVLPPLLIGVRSSRGARQVVGRVERHGRVVHGERRLQATIGLYPVCRIPFNIERLSTDQLPLREVDVDRMRVHRQVGDLPQLRGAELRRLRDRSVPHLPVERHHEWAIVACDLVECLRPRRRRGAEAWELVNARVQNRWKVGRLLARIASHGELHDLSCGVRID